MYTYNKFRRLITILELEENKSKLIEIKKKMDSLQISLEKIKDIEIEVKKLDDKTLENGFWEDTKNSAKILQEVKRVKSKYNKMKSILSEYDALIDLNELLLIENDEDMQNELVAGTKKLEKKLDKYEVELLLSGKYDRNNAIITLHPGAGGTESQDWAQMLYRMYLRWKKTYIFCFCRSVARNNR